MDSEKEEMIGIAFTVNNKTGHNAHYRNATIPTQAIRNTDMDATSVHKGLMCNVCSTARRYMRVTRA